MKSPYCTLTDIELIEKVELLIKELIDTGGKSWTMQIPARPNADHDLVFSELNQRFKAKTQTGARWVKASEFKTHKPIYRPYRKPSEYEEGEYDYGEIYATEDDGRIYLDVDNENNYEHQSDERWKDYEILDESAAGREDAVEFAEWAATIAFYDDGTRLWELIGEGEAINGQFRFTTNEFFELFKQQKEK